LEGKGSQIKKEVFIACPVCYSGNRFQLERPGGEFKCDDCGFVLAEDHGPDASRPEECIFCGSRNFYFESPLDLTILGRASICYVCEARYKGVGIDGPDEKYDQEGARRARRSWSSLRWGERVKGYSRQADV
jgi:hypothetical protein